MRSYSRRWGHGWGHGPHGTEQAQVCDSCSVRLGVCCVLAGLLLAAFAPVGQAVRRVPERCLSPGGDHLGKYSAEFAQPWQPVTRRRHGRVVRLTFAGFGGERIHHVRVTDLARAVRITLLTYVYTGPDPSTCAGESGCLDIHLRAPLGQREVIDGATRRSYRIGFRKPEGLARGHCPTPPNRYAGSRPARRQMRPR